MILYVFKISVEEVTVLEWTQEEIQNQKRLKRYLYFLDSALGEDAVNSFAITTNDLECYINLVDRAITQLEKTHCNFQSSPVNEMLSNNATDKFLMKEKVDNRAKFTVLLY